MMMRGTTLALALALALSFGCQAGSHEAEPGVQASAAGPTALPETAVPPSTVPPEAGMPAGLAALGIPNARLPKPNLLSSGQLSREQMTSLHELGYRTFISLQPADESGAGWEEEFATSEGLDFHRVPVAGAVGITRENAERLAGLLADAGDGPVAVYCMSGNRVGALLALNAHFLDGMSAEEAVAYGKEAGLTRAESTVRELLSAE